MEDESRTMLGKNQLSWLQDNLENSQAKHKIIANETMIMPMSLLRASKGNIPVEGPFKSFSQGLNGFYVNLDSWDGFPYERSVLLEFIETKKIENVLFCTGDIHTGIAGSVHLEPMNPNSSSIVAHEIVTPSVTSATLSDLVLKPGLPLLRRLISEANSHYQYLDTVNHGFVKLCLSSEKSSFRADFVPNDCTSNV